MHRVPSLFLGSCMCCSWLVGVEDRGEDVFAWATVAGVLVPPLAVAAGWAGPHPMPGRAAGDEGSLLRRHDGADLDEPPRVTQARWFGVEALGRKWELAPVPLLCDRVVAERSLRAELAHRPDRSLGCHPRCGDVLGAESRKRSERSIERLCF